MSISFIIEILEVALVVYAFTWMKVRKYEFVIAYNDFLIETLGINFHINISDEYKYDDRVKPYQDKIEKEFLGRRKFWMKISAFIALIPFFFYPRLRTSDIIFANFIINYTSIYTLVAYTLKLYIFNSSIFAIAEPVNTVKKDFDFVKKLLLTPHPYICLCFFILLNYLFVHY